MRWTVGHTRRIDPGQDGEISHAAVVQIENGIEVRRVIVELTRSAADDGYRFDPAAAVQGFLDLEDPPGRLVVSTAGVSPA